MRKNLIVFSLLGTSLVTPNLINYQLSNRENIRQMKVYRDMKKHYINTKFYAEHIQDVNHTQLLDNASLNWFHNTIFCIIKIKKRILQ